MIALVPQADSVAGRALKWMGKLLGLRSETVYSRAILLLALLLFVVVGVSVILVWHVVFKQFDNEDEADLMASAQRVKMHLKAGDPGDIGQNLAGISALLGRRVSLEAGGGSAENSGGGISLRVSADGSQQAVFGVTGRDGKFLGSVIVGGRGPFHLAGELAARIFVVGVAVVGGVMLILMLIVVDRTVLSRIQLLAGRVEGEKRSERLPVRLDVPGDDEIAQLAESIEELARLVQAAEREYRSVVEDQTESICRFDAAWRIGVFNRAFEDLCETKPVSGRTTLPECLVAPAWKAIAGAFKGLTPEKSVAAFTHIVQKGDDPAVWYRSTLRANFDAEGRPAGGQWIATNVSTEVAAQSELQESRSQLEELSARLMNLQDDERRRIARDLHDSTAQSLSALEMNMSVLESLTDAKKMRQIASETRAISRQVCRELRNISYLLHPPLLEEEGLAFAIRWFADGFTKRNGIPVTLDLQDDFPRLEPEEETALFRIVQEALGNIYRHAGANKAWIMLRHHDTGEVALEVRDNGRGLPEGFSFNKSAGVGLGGMRERMKQFGGTLDVGSSPYGVAVTCRLSGDSSAKTKGAMES